MDLFHKRLTNESVFVYSISYGIDEIEFGGVRLNAFEDL